MQPDILALRPGYREETREGPNKLPLPPQYSDDLARAILASIIANGVHPEIAAEAAGLPRAVFFEWKRAAEAGTAHSKIQEFNASIARAEATYEQNLVSSLNQDLSPADRLKMLERRFNQRWSQQLNVKLNDEIEAVILRLQALKNVDRMMTGQEAFMEVIKLISSG